MSQQSQQATLPPSGLVLAFGGATLFFGIMITSFSGPSGRIPGIVITCIGTLLTVPGVIAFRRARRRAYFKITKPWSVLTFLFLLGMIAVIVTGSLLIVAVLDTTTGIRIPGALLFIPGIGLAYKIYFSLRTVVLINAQGLNLGGITVPWSAVDHVYVAGADAPGMTTVGAELRKDAPPLNVPDWVTNSEDLKRHPRMDVHTKKLNLAEMKDAVTRFGPPGVQVVERPRVFG